jgi:hypothetical protein
MNAPPKATAEPPKLSKLEQLLLEKIWGKVKPKLDAAFVAAKTKLLDALKGQPLVVIGSIVAALDVFLLRGPKPRTAEQTKFLTDARKFLGDVQLFIDRVLAPPKPISAGLRKALAGIVTIAGMLGLYQAGKAAVSK